jgi:drug/metabolite transporter (DMT)-like permease
MSASTTKRPFGATILAILAGVLAVIAGIHTLQSLGILPFFIGDFSFRAFSFFNALMWGLMVWVYVWLIQMLWRVDPQAWLFLAVITVFNLILDFTMMLGSAEWNDVSVSFIINGLILIYVMLPGTRRAFGQR